MAKYLSNEVENSSAMNGISTALIDLPKYQLSLDFHKD